MNYSTYIKISAIDYEIAIPKRNPIELLSKAIGSTKFDPLSILEYNPVDGKTTELFECLEALNIYKQDPSFDNEVELLLEIGDLLNQIFILEGKYKEDSSYSYVNKELKNAVNHIYSKYPFKAEEAKALSVMKIMSRECLKRKDKDVEHELAKIILSNMRIK